MLVPVDVKSKAISFLFPTLGEETKAYKEISRYIEKQVKSIHCCVLYKLNQDFAKISNKYALDLGMKEVLITSGHVSASENYKNELRTIMKTDPFKKFKRQNQTSDSLLFHEDSYCTD